MKYFSYSISLLLLSFLNQVLGIFGASENGIILKHSSESCSESCVKSIIRQIFFKDLSLDEKLTDKDVVKFEISFTGSEFSLILDYLTNDSPWLTRDQVIDKLSDATTRGDHIIDEFDSGHKYNAGVSPKALIIGCTGCFAVAVIYTIVTRESNALAAILTLCLAFFTGLAWNWWKRYQEEFHRRVHNLPDECKQETSSWYHSFKGFIIDSKCDDYFKAAVDDPLAMVSPGVILEDTFSMLFITPLTLISWSFSSTVKQLSENMTWPLNWILQFVLSIMLIAGITAGMLTTLASLLDREISFSTGILSGRIHRPRLVRKKAVPKSKSSIELSRCSSLSSDMSMLDCNR